MNVKNYYQSCAVPCCKSTTIKTPTKLFIHVPFKTNMRNKWLELAKVNVKNVSAKSNLFFCEDHFNLSNDMENYMEYHIFGSVKKISMKPTCLPSKFTCQPNHRKKNTVTTVTVDLKSKRKELVEQLLRDDKENEMGEASSHTTHLPQPSSSESSSNMESDSKKKKKKTKVDENSASYINQREKAKIRKLRYIQKLTEEQKELKREKDREYYRKRMEKSKRKSITEMSDTEKSKQRELWRETSKKYRQRKKSTKTTPKSPTILKEPKSFGAKLKKLKEKMDDADSSKMTIENICTLSTEDHTKKLTEAKKNESPSTSKADDEKEYEIEIEIKQETNEDPLDFERVDVKIEPTDDFDEKFEVDVPIKNEYDESLFVEENSVSITVEEKKPEI